MFYQSQKHADKKIMQLHKYWYLSSKGLCCIHTIMQKCIRPVKLCFSILGSVCRDIMPFLLLLRHRKALFKDSKWHCFRISILKAARLAIPRGNRRKFKLNFIHTAKVFSSLRETPSSVIFQTLLLLLSLGLLWTY